MTKPTLSRERIKELRDSIGAMYDDELTLGRDDAEGLIRMALGYLNLKEAGVVLALNRVLIQVAPKSYAGDAATSALARLDELEGK